MSGHSAQNQNKYPYEQKMDQAVGLDPASLSQAKLRV